MGQWFHGRRHLQGTHLGPLDLPFGTLRPTGKRMDAPCNLHAALEH